jgi:hypothetical protein
MCYKLFYAQDDVFEYELLVLFLQNYSSVKGVVKDKTVLYLRCK